VTPDRRRQARMRTSDSHEDIYDEKRGSNFVSKEGIESPVLARWLSGQLASIAVAQQQSLSLTFAICDCTTQSRTISVK
jgi:hypothetical protein